MWVVRKVRRESRADGGRWVQGVGGAVGIPRLGIGGIRCGWVL